MALVCARQEFVVDGYKEVKRKKPFGKKIEYVKEPIRYLTGVEVICDELEVNNIIEEKIKEKLEEEKGRNDNFNGEVSYRKYAEPAELYGCHDRIEFKLQIEYIRDWKMQKILQELDANQFAILCKELGISGAKAVARA